MKYDRPVRELLAECVRQLPEPFTTRDVVDWFGLRYPDISAGTISTHLAGLTAGARPHRNLRQYAPVVERIGHGSYRRVAAGDTAAPPSAEVRPVPEPAPRAAGSADVVLLGCVKSKRTEAVAAKDLYTSALFAKRRAYAERCGKPWFVVSARHGLIHPTEIIAPYDLHLGSASSSYRRAWGEFVAAQLTEVMNVSGLTVEIHAGDAYVDPLRDPLGRAGATVTDPVVASSLGATLRWYEEARQAPTGGESYIRDSGIEASAVIDRLGDESRAVSLTALRELDKSTLDSPGMYSWWVDGLGAQELSGGLGHLVRPGLIYVGQAGATRWPSGRRSSNTLRGRLIGMHLGQNAELSTFRKTLGGILGLTSPDDAAALTDWMSCHLRVAVCPIPDADSIDAVETAVLADLDPPLNLRKVGATPLRSSLTALRNPR